MSSYRSGSGYAHTPCLERVRRLERQGFIQDYTALLNPHYLDASLLVFVEITLNRGVPDMSAYRKLLGETLRRLPGVNDTRTYCGHGRSETE